jgi:hypothetical protein
MASAIVSMADVRKQLSMLGYSNVPDKLVEEFLDEINSTAAPAPAPATPAAALPAAPAPASASPKTPPRASQRAPQRAPPSPFGPWQGAEDGDGDDDGGPANPTSMPDSPFDDPSRNSFPPWYSTPPPPGTAQGRPKQQPTRREAIAAEASTPLPASPPFEVEASPPTSVLKSRPGRVRVDGQTTPGTAVKSKRRASKRGKKKPAASAGVDDAGLHGTPAPNRSAASMPVRTPGSESESRTAPSAPSKKKTVSRTMGPRAPSPKATPRRSASAETPRPQTAPGSQQRHVSGQSVIYTKLNTPKQRASVRGLGFKKSDPVAMHQKHMKAWNSSSFALGRPSRDRGSQTARPRTAPAGSPRQHAAEKGFVVPTEKRRDNLRWEIRMQMASPPH